MQEHLNKMTELMEESDKAFKRLQDLNGSEGTGTRWCCAKTNALDLLGCGKDYMHIYDDYVKANAKLDLLREFGSTLAELNFWK